MKNRVRGGDGISQDAQFMVIKNEHFFLRCPSSLKKFFKGVSPIINQKGEEEKWGK